MVRESWRVRRQKAVRAGLLAGASLLSAAGLADAAEPPSTQGEAVAAWGAWSAPEECIAEEALLQQVEASFGSEGPATHRRVEGTMRRRPGGWVVRFEVHQDQQRLGERRLDLTGSDCRDHDDTVALVLSLLLEDGPPPVDPPAAAEGAESDRTGAERKVEEPTSRQVPRFWTSLGASADLGLTAGLGWGTQLSLAWRTWGPWALRLDGAVHFGPEQTEVWGSWTTRALRLGAGPCLEPWWGPWGLAGCLGAEALSYSARALGGVDGRRSTSWAVAGVARAEGRRALGRHLFLSVSSSGAVASRTFRVVLSTPTGPQEVWESAVLFGTVALGLGTRF